MIYLDIAFVVFLMFCNGMFAMSELAIVSSKKVHLKRLADEGSRGARIALEFAQDTGRFLPTVQIGITLIGILSGTVGGATLSEPLANYLVTYNMALDTAQIISVTLIVAAITYFTLIIGELVPKELALRNPERMAVLIAPPIYVLMRITSPLVWLLDLSCKLVLKLIGARQKPKTTVTEEEVRSMIAEGTEHGLFHEAERDMISGVMLLADKPIRAFMLPRMDVIAIEHDATLEQAGAIFTQHHHSRYPVIKGEEILGLLQTKDVLSSLLVKQEWSIPALMVEAPRFKDSTPTLEVIDHLRRAVLHIAVITDEQGAYLGIVTLTGLVEVITGELYGFGDEPIGITERHDGSWLMDGSILLEVAFRKLGIAEVPEHEHFHTLAGFLLQRMAYIPKAGDSFDFKGYRFEVVDMDRVRIDKVLIARVVE